MGLFSWINFLHINPQMALFLLVIRTANHADVMANEHGKAELVDGQKNSKHRDDQVQGLQVLHFNSRSNH